MKKRILFFLIIILSIFAINFSAAAPMPWGIAINSEKQECSGFWGGDEFREYYLPEGWADYYPDYASQRINVTKPGLCLYNFFEEDGCYRCMEPMYTWFAEECYETYEECIYRIPGTSESIQWICINASVQRDIQCSGYFQEYGIFNFHECYSTYDQCITRSIKGSCANISKYHPTCNGYGFMEDEGKSEECYNFYECKEDCYFTYEREEERGIIDTSYGSCNFTNGENCCEELGLNYITEIPSVKRTTNYWLLITFYHPSLIPLVYGGIIAVLIAVFFLIRYFIRRAKRKRFKK